MFIIRNVLKKRVCKTLEYQSNLFNLDYLLLFKNNKSHYNTIMSDKTIGTHDGIFHCDEVLACFMLQELPEYKNAKIIRTRDESILKNCSIVVDVGSNFDVNNNKFDHHQNTFKETLGSLRPELGNWDIKLSSAGLIYTYFGEKIIKTILKDKRNYDITNDCLINIYKKIYEYFIREIDAIDNGVPMYDGEPKYQISTHLSARVSQFNPVWNSTEKADIQEQFEKAKKLVGEEFIEQIYYYTFSWWPARSIVKNSIDSCKEVHASGEILELKQFCPWKQHLFQLEKEMKIEGIPKYVIMENKTNDWRVICVPNSPSSFICRKFLHKDWRGIRDEDLAKLSEIEGVNFVHATGFIGGAKTRNGALMMALKSLEGDFEN